MILPRWISRLAAILLLAGVLAFFFAFVVAPLIGRYSDTEEAIAHARELLGRYARAEADRDRLQAQRDALERRSSDRGGVYLTGSTEALAAADLQNRVKSVIQANGGLLHSIQAISNRSEEHFQVVTIRVQMTASTETLYRVFYQLEAQEPYLFLDNIDIRSRMTRSLSDGAAPRPQVRFDVFGFLPVGK